MQKLGVSSATLHRPVGASDLKLIKIGKRTSGITADSIHALVTLAAVSD